MKQSMKAYELVNYLATLAADRAFFVRTVSSAAGTSEELIEMWLSGTGQLVRDRQVAAVTAAGYFQKALTSHKVHYFRIDDKAISSPLHHKGYAALSALLGLSIGDQKILDRPVVASASKKNGGSAKGFVPHSLFAQAVTIQKVRNNPSEFVARRSEEMEQARANAAPTTGAASVSCLLPRPIVHFISDESSQRHRSRTLRFLLCSDEVKVVVEVAAPWFGTSKFSRWIESAVALLRTRRRAAGEDIEISRMGQLHFGNAGMRRLRERALTCREIEIALSGTSIEDLHDTAAWQRVYFFAAEHGIMPSVALAIVMEEADRRNALRSTENGSAVRLISGASEVDDQKVPSQVKAEVQPFPNPVASADLVVGGYIQVETKPRRAIGA